MLGHFYAVMSDDVRSLTILNDAVLNARATHGHNSVIACHCTYHLGIAFFIQKNVIAALECLAPLTDTAILHGGRSAVFLMFVSSVLHAFRCSG